MSKKFLSGALLVSVFVLVSGITTGWAEDPSSLIIVRGTDNSLHYKVCLGSTCTPFTWFPGQFASEPSVYWDEVIRRYVVFGRSADNSIWRSTFTQAGTFNNDWAYVPGATPSPLGAAGSNLITPKFNSTNEGSVNVSTIGACNSWTTLTSLTFTPTRNGYVQVFANGIYAPWQVDKYARVCIGDEIASCGSLAPILESNTVTNYQGEKNYALQQWYNVSAGVSKTFYLRACKEDTATSGIMQWNGLSVQFQVVN